ncbi:hypothetical protein M3201_13210 [Paenibacillus motobuensis]|nr:MULTISPECIES: hypothetical protein [Paenibacillus]MCM3040655.1 hypothetical protein [Paenibacillus lutimineralis]MCM3647759.1 hypothetical protein [Paenibacillus motobuensis]
MKAFDCKLIGLQQELEFGRQVRNRMYTNFWQKEIYITLGVDLPSSL